MSKGRLDFLVIGAMRSGTTSLFEHLRTHPDLYLPPAKELPFFSDDSVFERGWDAYARVAFAAVPRDRLWGTVTPQYMGAVRFEEATRRVAAEHPGEIVPERIASLCPDIKLIALLREPVERAISHYWFCVREGLEDRSIDDALGDSLSPRALWDARAVPNESNSYVALGEYGRLLAAYVARFPRSQLCVVSAHGLDRDPIRVMRELWRFLGVDDSHVPPRLDARHHTGSARRRVPIHPWSPARAILATPLSRVWEALPGGARDSVRRGYRTAAFRFAVWNRDARAPAAGQPGPALRERLTAHYRSDLARLEALVGPVAGVTTPDRVAATPD